MKHEARVLVFDLDGTLYEDTHHFDYYAKRLQEKLVTENKRNFWEDYQEAKDGNHTLKIGRVYDAINDLILTHVDGKIIDAFSWDGTRVKNTQELYPEPVTFNLTNMLSIGDLWWIPASIARHYGLSEEKSYDAFIETRKFMMSEAFQMTPIKGLQKILESLHNHVQLVLLTNSPKVDSERILEKVCLSHVFHHQIFEAKKPSLTTQHLKEIQATYDVDFSDIISVGDNWINEILPAKKLGCKTIYIHPYNVGGTLDADYVVQSGNEMVNILNSLLN